MADLRSIAAWVGRSGKRVAITLVGFALVAIGIVLLPLPGPGMLLIVLGLAVLATEYAWARRALDETKRRGGEAMRRVFRRRRR